ncbi:hypothetical protein LVJ94_34680 [Pendulispora rubella]|uniref:Uncharacterized protein n=1 Tax=Pendulispora rubella TaxID=2741070 RepID=A0ABZ2KTN4_9BACT
MKPIEQRVYEAYAAVLRRSSWNVATWENLPDGTKDSWDAIATVVRDESGDRDAKLAAAWHCARDLGMTNVPRWADLSDLRKSAWNAVVDTVLEAPPKCRDCGEESLFAKIDPWERGLCYACSRAAPEQKHPCAQCRKRSHQAANHPKRLCYACTAHVT